MVIRRNVEEDLSQYFKQNSFTKRFDLQQNNEHLESQWIEIQLPYQKKYIIGNLYRPPNRDAEKAIELLNNTFEKIKLNQNTEIFCLGDLNIDLIKPSKARKTSTTLHEPMD